MRIGIIGLGRIGSFIYEEINKNKELPIEIAFVHDIDQEKLKALPEDVVLEKMEEFERKSPDLVLESSHPDVVKKWGEFILSKCNFMIMSVTAMADQDLEKRLLDTCNRYNSSLFIPHGALVGLDGIIDGKDIWEEVTITMHKNPKNLDFSASNIDPLTIKEKRVIYDGPVRGVCSQFPRNVNSHATLALAGIGMDKTRSVLIADPSLDESIIEIMAKSGGTMIEIKRRNPIKGVTGKLTLLSVFSTLLRVTNIGSGIHII
ncbi:MAG: DUF108 domain-containing protein [Deltaproteobacteria bacterium]|nr:DUF108 domain-containing protein [Deltaproteobacteria bacterium]